MHTVAMTLVGYGNVYLRERWVAAVAYSISTWLTTYPHLPPALGDAWLEHAYGQLARMALGVRLPLGVACILELDDGRRCRVLLTRVSNPTEDAFTVQFVDLAELE